MLCSLVYYILLVLYQSIEGLLHLKIFNYYKVHAINSTIHIEIAGRIVSPFFASLLLNLKQLKYWTLSYFCILIIIHNQNLKATLRLTSMYVWILYISSYNHYSNHAINGRQCNYGTEMNLQYNTQKLHKLHFS